MSHAEAGEHLNSDQRQMLIYALSFAKTNLEYFFGLKGADVLGYSDPQSATEWFAVAEERSADAATLEGNSRVISAQYFHGFALECMAKALYQIHHRGRPPQTHDIMHIILGSRLRREQFTEEWLRAAESREVSLRYQDQTSIAASGEFSADDTTHLREFTGYIRALVNRRLNRIDSRKSRRA